MYRYIILRLQASSQTNPPARDFITDPAPVATQHPRAGNQPVRAAPGRTSL